MRCDCGQLASYIVQIRYGKRLEKMPLCTAHYIEYLEMELLKIRGHVDDVGRDCVIKQPETASA